MENTLDIKKLSSADRKALQAQIKAEDKAEKEKRQGDIATLKELSTQFVEANIDTLISQQMDVEKIVNNVFAGFTNILKLKADIYGLDRLEQESHTVTHPEGKCSVTIGYNVNISFDGTESAGVQMVTDYLDALSGDTENENLQKLAIACKLLLKPNLKTNMLNPIKIIQLNEMRSTFNSPEFEEGLDIIIAAQHRVKGSSFVSGWKMIEVAENRTKKLEFRFSV